MHALNLREIDELRAARARGELPSRAEVEAKLAGVAPPKQANPFDAIEKRLREREALAEKLAGDPDFLRACEEEERGPPPLEAVDKADAPLTPIHLPRLTVMRRWFDSITGPSKSGDVTYRRLSRRQHGPEKKASCNPGKSRAPRQSKQAHDH